MKVGENRSVGGKRMEKWTKSELHSKLQWTQMELAKAEEEVRNLRKALESEGWNKRAFDRPIVHPIYRMDGEERKRRQVGKTRNYDSYHAARNTTWREYWPLANFRELMGALGMTPHDFARCYGVSRQAIEGMLEREARWAMRLDTVAKMAQCIECEVVVFVRPKFGLSAQDFRKTAAFKLRTAQGKGAYSAARYADEMERGAKMDWENWALMKRQGRL